jgi:hypothetical protein
VCLSLLGTVIAAYTALQASDAVKVAARGIEQQGNADRLATAMSSIGAEQAAVRVTGFALLRRHVQDRVTNPDSADRRDAYTVYISALDLLENYLRIPPDVSAEAGAEPAGLGFGRPRIPGDNRYAAGELLSLMRLEPEIEKLRSSIQAETQDLVVDLSNVQLYRQSWPNIDFAWLGAQFFPGIDLRGANLRDSVWGASHLEGAHLQCAELEGANLEGALLVKADLRGANLEGADFTDAELTDVKLDGATGWQQAKGLPKNLRPPPGISRAHDGIDKCLDHKPYWESRQRP